MVAYPRAMRKSTATSEFPLHASMRAERGCVRVVALMSMPSARSVVRASISPLAAATGSGGSGRACSAISKCPLALPGTALPVVTRAWTSYEASYASQPHAAAGYST